MNRIQEIIQHESDAEQLEKDADHHKWEAARLISEELSEGTSQRELARQIGKSQTHVADMKGVWTKYRTVNRSDWPPFNKAYNERHENYEQKPKPEPEPEGKRKRRQFHPEPEDEHEEEDDEEEEEEQDDEWTSEMKNAARSERIASHMHAASAELSKAANILAGTRLTNVSSINTAIRLCRESLSWIEDHKDNTSTVDEEAERLFGK